MSNKHWRYRSLGFAMSFGHCAGCLAEGHISQSKDLLSLNVQHIVPLGLHTDGMFAALLGECREFAGIVDPLRPGADFVQRDPRNTVLTCQAHNAAFDTDVVGRVRTVLDVGVDWQRKALDRWFAARTERLLAWRSSSSALVDTSPLLADLDLAALRELLARFLRVRKDTFEELSAEEWLRHAQDLLSLFAAHNQPSSDADIAKAASDLLRGWLLAELSSRLGPGFGDVLLVPAREARVALVRYLDRVVFRNLRWFALWEDAVHVAVLSRYRESPRPLSMPVPSRRRDVLFYQRISTILSQSATVYEHPLAEFGLVGLLDFGATQDCVHETLDNIYHCLEESVGGTAADDVALLAAIQEFSRQGIGDVRRSLKFGPESDRA